MMKRIMTFVLAAAMLALMLCGCQEPQNSTPATTTLSATAQYTVKVVDPAGNPVAGVGVKFLKAGEQVGMAMGNDQGIASKELDRGDYTLVLSFQDTEHSYHYEVENAKLTATQTEVEIMVCYEMGEVSTVLMVQDTQYDAYSVDVGFTYVKLAASGRNYFIFTPKQDGVYRISVKGEGVTVGLYGTPFYVYDQSTEEVKDGAFEVTVSKDMIGQGNTGTTQLVIGVDSEKADINCYLGIERVSNPPAAVEWQEYQATYYPTKYKLPAGLELKSFDLTAETYKLVYNETDQYYHLNSADGPVVLVHLLSAGSYSEMIFGNILLCTNIGTYHYDEEGKLSHKILYNGCIEPYLGTITGTGENAKFTGGMCDDTYGVYPLTKDLETIIKNYGAFKGYWNSESPEFLLGDVIGLNPENAWLFLCSYAE